MFRKMRRHGQQLDHETCETILRTAPRGVLAVLGDEGYPYAVPLDFLYDAGKIYFHSAQEGHKLDAIGKCGKASFCVLDEGRKEDGAWWYHFNSVVAFGHIRLLEDEAEKIVPLRKLGEKYFPPEVDLEADIARNFKRVAVLELAIEHMTGKHVREN